MNNFNRFLIMILIFALLFALYRYQQTIVDNESKSKKPKKKKKKQSAKGEITLDNVSQLSLGSLEDIRSTDENPYQPHSLFNSSIDESRIGTEGSDGESFLGG